MYRQLTSVMAVAAALAASPATAQIVNNEWNAGDGVWNVSSNWFPFGVPDNGADGFDYSVVIGNRAVAANAVVTFVPRDGVSDAISAFSLSGGADFLTNGHRLITLGQSTVDGLGTTLRVDPNAAPGAISFQTLNLVVRNQAALRLNGGVIYAATIDVANATTEGGGLVIFGDADAVQEDAFDNSGTIRVGLGGTDNNTLTLQTNGIDWIDLDGDDEQGSIDVSNHEADPLADALTLIIDAPLQDAFGGLMQIGSRDKVEFRQRMLLTGATVELDGGEHLATLANVGQTGLVNSTTFTVAGDALLRGPMAIGMSHITVGPAATLTLEGNIGIDRTSLLLQNGSGLIIAGNVSITDTASFDWDGANGNATTTIHDNQMLTIAVAQVEEGNNDYHGTLNLIGAAKASVNVAATAWTMAGTINKTGAGVASITGDVVDVWGDVNVSSGVLTIANATLLPDAAIQIDADAVLELGEGSRFAQPTSVTGAGTLRVLGASSVVDHTKIDVATFDWDGADGGQRQLVGNGITFVINAERFDDDGDMDDRIIVGGRGARLIVNGPAEWTMNNILAVGIGASVNRGSSTIGGTSRLVLANRFNVDGLVFIEAPITFGDGSSSVTGVGTRLNVANDALYRSGNIIGDGTYEPGAMNRVTGAPNINVRHFDFDRGEWQVLEGGHLLVNVTNYDLHEAVQAFDGRITLANGDVTMNSAQARFIMNGTLTMTSTVPGQTVDWGGEPISIGDDNGALDAKLIVNGNQTSRFVTDVLINGDAKITVAAGATLSFDNHVEFNTLSPSGSAEISGAGKLNFRRGVNFSDPVTLNMQGGVVDLDGDDATGDVVNVFGTTVMNAGEFSSFGRDNGMSGLNSLNVDSEFGFGSLAVNLDAPTGRWRLNPEGILNLSNGVNRETLLAGSDVALDGTVNVRGDVQVDARVILGGTVEISTAGRPLQLNGGDQGNIPNRIAGATVSGAGVLGANGDRALYGFGTINSAIDFDDTAILRADDGVLTISGPILDVGQIGTEDVDGILHVANPWNSNVADLVRLKGGELRGGAVTIANAEGLVGHGLVSARIVNNTQTVARSGMLTLNTAANDNDWDGATNSGRLGAIGGHTLELRDDADFAFAGSVSASGGGRVLARGFALNFAAGSTLTLDAGTYESTHATSVAGNLLATGASRVLLGAGAGFTLKQGSATNVAGELTLPTTRTVIEAGASFAGAGALLAPVGSELSIDANGVVDVLVDNRGQLTPAGNGGIGRITLGEFQQASSGTLALEFAGVGLNQFDRLTVTGGALLGGKLNIAVQSGFVPTLGQMFNVLTAADGISGTFSSILATNMPAGLSFQTSYLPTIVQLKVISGPAFSADFDRDGDVDGDDLTVWRATFGAGSGGDADGDLDTDGDDFMEWQRQFGSRINPGLVSQPPLAVPEPASAALAVVAGALLLFRRRRPLN